MSATSGGVLFQNSLYVGINLEDIMYGIELVLYFRTMHCLLYHTRRRTRSDVFYATFSSVMLLLITVWVSTQAINGQKMWLMNGNFPATADAFWEANISSWYMQLATISATVLQLMTDALMVYRCWMVWHNYYIIALPVILWVGTLALGILVICITTASGGGVYFHNTAAQVALGFYSTSVFLTVMVTCTICYRVLWHGRLMKKLLPYEHEHGSPYFAIAALIVESVLPYSLSGIAYVVTIGMGSQLMGVFGYVYFLMMCVSPQMVILRVAMEVAWTDDTLKQPHTTLKFSPQAQETISTCIEIPSLRGTDTDVEIDLERR